jgi:hypothetical protein
VLSIGEHIHEYNTVFLLYDDVAVWDWPLARVKEILRHPPDPVKTITAIHWASPHAVIHLLGSKLPVSAEQWTRGFSPSTLQTVRDYFTSEDPWVLRTAPDPKAVAELFKVLYREGVVEMCGSHYLPRKKHKTPTPLPWRTPASMSHGLLIDVAPSFAQIRRGAGECKPEHHDVVEVEEMPTGGGVLAVAFTQWDVAAAAPTRAVLWENVREAIFGSVVYNKVVFVTRSRQFLLQLTLDHAVYPGVTRLDVLCHYIAVLVAKRTRSGTVAFNMFINQ